MDINAVAAKFAYLKQLKEQHEAAIKIIDTQLVIEGQLLYKLFTDTDTPAESVRIAGSLFKDQQARIISPQVELKPSVRVEDKPKFCTWLKENGHGSLVKEDVHYQTLKSWVNKMKDDNLPLPEVVQIYTIETATVRRAPKKA